MPKTKLSDFIERLELMGKDYKKNFNQEPYIWDLDSFGGEITSITLSPKPKKAKVGTSVKSEFVKEYDFDNG